MTLANRITLFRLLAGPLFLIFYHFHSAFGLSFEPAVYFLIGILALSEASDALDGYLARRQNKVTELGKILDPMADSLYRISVFLTFTLPPVELPLLLVFMFIYRDSIISILRTICALKGIALGARTSGKLKAITQGVAAFSILILLVFYAKGALSLEALKMGSFWIALTAAIYTLISGIEYLLHHKKMIFDALKETEND